MVEILAEKAYCYGACRTVAAPTDLISGHRASRDPVSRITHDTGSTGTALGLIRWTAIRQSFRYLGLIAGRVRGRVAATAAGVGAAGVTSAATIASAATITLVATLPLGLWVSILSVPLLTAQPAAGRPGQTGARLAPAGLAFGLAPVGLGMLLGKELGNICILLKEGPDNCQCAISGVLIREVVELCQLPDVTL